MPAARPVSDWLIDRLATCVREQGVVVWLDAPGHYVELVDAMRVDARVDYPVRALRGSYLELVLALDDVAAKIDPTRVLIHLPGVDRRAVAHTPLYELQLASRGRDEAFELELAAVVTAAAAGKVLPDVIAAFVRELGGEPGEVALARADAWLAAQLDVPRSPAEAALRVMRPREVLDDLLGREPAQRLDAVAQREALIERMQVWLGMPVDWQVDAPDPGDVVALAASWALCVEYVDDRASPPAQAELRGIRSLPRALIDECRALAEHLRRHHVGVYRRVADETEQRLDVEVAAARAEDLGAIDTFRFEERKVLEESLEQLATQAWARVEAWALQRVGASDSAWLRDDPLRRSTWELVLDAARLGRAIEQAGRLGPLSSVEAALDRYVQVGAAVDRAHRLLEQRRGERLDTQMPEFERLRARLDGMRLAYRAWADAWAVDVAAIGREYGVLPRAGLQQRTIFDEVVRASCRAGLTAYFMVDALRYEMAVELVEALGEREGVWLDARLAELPSVTEIGMNALAPVVERGRLHPLLDGKAKPRFVGFRVHEKRVDDPASRIAAMHERVGGRRPEAFSLDELLGSERRSLARRLAALSLVVVYSREIDEAGESGHGTAVFARVLQKLRGAWHLLRSAGVQRFVITADHGFMLLDETSATAQPYKRKTDVRRRYVIEPRAVVEYPHEVRVVPEMLDYEGLERDIQLVFTDSTAVFDTGAARESFVHGGLSLQERVIPVVRLVHAAPAGASLLRYRIEARAAGEQGGMHQVQARIELETRGALDFAGLRELELDLRVDLPDVVVELGSVLGAGRLADGRVVAEIGEWVQVFFRLRGPTQARARVEVHHPSRSAEVEPAALERRFAVIDTRPGAKPESLPDPQPAATPARGRRRAAGDAGDAWLEQLPAPLRPFFEHLARHGVVTASEAEQLLGGRRALRSLANQFDALVELLPFRVRIENVNGVKQYVRE
jgi:hypothetical protein